MTITKKFAAAAIATSISIVASSCSVSAFAFVPAALVPHQRGLAVHRRARAACLIYEDVDLDHCLLFDSPVLSRYGLILFTFQKVYSQPDDSFSCR